MISISDVQEYNMKKLTGNERTIYMFLCNQKKLIELAENNPTIFPHSVKQRYNMKELSKIVGIHVTNLRWYVRGLEKKNLLQTNMNKRRLEVIL